MERVKGSVRGLFFSLYLWVLLGFGLRLWRVFLQLVMFRDETTYAYQIKHILNGTIFNDATYYTFPPAYALLAAPIALVTHNPEFTGRLVSCVAGAATAIPAYYLARDLFGPRAAAIAAASTALFPPLISIPVMSEPTYCFLVTLSLYLGNRAYRSRRGRDYFLFGLVMAVSYLTRPEGFFIFFTYLALLAVMLIWDRVGWKRTTALAGLALLGFLLPAFPYILQVRAHFGRWEISGKTPINLAKVSAIETLKPGEDPEKRMEDAYKQYEKNKNGGGESALFGLSAMARRYPGNLWTELKSFTGMAGYPLLAACALGLGLAVSRPGPVREVLLPLAAFTPFLVIPAVFIIDRILAPYLPMLIIPAGYGIARVSDALGKLARDEASRLIVPSMNVVFSAFLFIGNFGGILPETDVRKVLRADEGYSYYYSLRLLATNMRGHIPPDSRIITRNNIFAYYAGAEYLPIPASDLDGLMKYARENGARYLFYGPMEQDLRPQFYPVFFRDGKPVEDPLQDGELVLVFSWNDYLLYEFSGKGGR